MKSSIALYSFVGPKTHPDSFEVNGLCGLLFSSSSLFQSGRLTLHILKRRLLVMSCDRNLTLFLKLDFRDWLSQYGDTAAGDTIPYRVIGKDGHSSDVGAMPASDVLRFFTDFTVALASVVSPHGKCTTFLFPLDHFVELSCMCICSR